MKKYNVVVARPFHDDPTKKVWKNVGSLVYFEPTEEKPEPGFILELNMYPTTDFKVFAATEKKPETQGTTTKQDRDAASDRALDDVLKGGKESQASAGGIEF